MTPMCGAELMEDDWEQGFECTLPTGHAGPHRDESPPEDPRSGEINESTDDEGRKYVWVYEWTYQ